MTARKKYSRKPDSKKWIPASPSLNGLDRAVLSALRTPDKFCGTLIPKWVACSTASSHPPQGVVAKYGHADSEGSLDTRSPI